MAGHWSINLNEHDLGQVFRVSRCRRTAGVPVVGGASFLAASDLLPYQPGARWRILALPFS
jgi:hypothetical protein